MWWVGGRDHGLILLPTSSRVTVITLTICYNQEEGGGGVVVILEVEAGVGAYPHTGAKVNNK